MFRQLLTNTNETIQYATVRTRKFGVAESDELNKAQVEQYHIGRWRLILEDEDIIAVEVGTRHCSC